MAVLAILMLSACVPGHGESDLSAAAPQASPLAAEVIETTSLDTPAAQPAPAPDEAALAVPEATEEVAPASPEEVRCLATGGTWAAAGQSGAKACVTLTRDGGKACTRQSQCEGYCLARSGTCAPITPMFGCNDILQDDGREVTLCLD
jgi:putative hemolysin